MGRDPRVIAEVVVIVVEVVEEEVTWIKEVEVVEGEVGLLLLLQLMYCDQLVYRSLRATRDPSN